MTEVEPGCKTCLRKAKSGSTKAMEELGNGLWRCKKCRFVWNKPSPDQKQRRAFDK